METQIRRQLLIFKWYTVATTLALGALAFATFKQGQKTDFKEINTERINIVEPDNKLRIVLSNQPRSPGPIYQGKPFGYPGGTRPGIIFYNDEETENGGLIFKGKRQNNGTYNAASGFSFDQFNTDETISFGYDDENGKRDTSLTIVDRAPVNIYDLVMEQNSIMKMATGTARDTALKRFAEPRDGVPLAAERVYIGRDPNKTAAINLSDPNGKVRIRMQVDSTGTPSLEFLDKNGMVTAHFPEIKRKI
jgi:hypothetical protein